MTNVKQFKRENLWPDLCTKKLTLIFTLFQIQISCELNIYYLSPLNGIAIQYRDHYICYIT